MGILRHSILPFLLAFLFSATGFGSSQLKEGRNEIILRGQREEIYFYHSTQYDAKPTSTVLFAPGDGGWRGFADKIGKTVASFGYNVYGLDTKRYLESFTGKSTLRPSEIMCDFEQIAKKINNRNDNRITLVGWSEGAGLCLLAGASQKNKRIFDGVVTIGLNETTALGWRWVDDITYLTKSNPHEPVFASADYMAQITPLPIVMLHSTADEYVSVETAKTMFARAQQPKRLVFITANNHRFDNNQLLFFDQLREALQWVRSQTAANP